MAVSLREYRARIKSTESMKKITRAMELIAASRIIKAQQRARAAAPYARELTRAVSALATYSSVDHPMTTEPEDPKAAVLIVTSDRGLAGAYSSNVLKEGERLAEHAHSEGKEIATYIAGRKGEAYYRFRDRPVAGSWPASPTSRSTTTPHEVGEALIEAFMAEEGEDGARRRGARRLHPFRSMLVQEPHRVRLLPLEVVEGEERPESRRGAAALRVRALRRGRCSTQLLPKYVQSRIFFALLQASASELAARQKAMKSATDNADELIKKYTRIANQARQAGITQEISEIVGGVNALADATPPASDRRGVSERHDCHC